MAIQKIGKNRTNQNKPRESKALLKCNDLPCIAMIIFLAELTGFDVSLSMLSRPHGGARI